MKYENITDLELGENDCAVVIREDLTVNYFVPKEPEDLSTPLPENVFMSTIILSLLFEANLDLLSELTNRFVTEANKHSAKEEVNEE